MIGQHKLKCQSQIKVFRVFGLINGELKQRHSWATKGNQKFNFLLLTPLDTIASVMEDTSHQNKSYSVQDK